MFEIEYKGGNSVVITTKARQLWIDPNMTSLGLKLPNIKNGVQLTTEPRFVIDQKSDDELVLSLPGEYEVGPFSIRGIAAKTHTAGDDVDKKSTLYHIDIGDIRIGLIGNVDADVDEDQLETIGVVDILILPVGGGGYTLDSTAAVALVRQIEPAVVIPVHYADKGISYPVPQEDIELFIKELNPSAVETAAKLKVKSAASLPQTLTLYQLERS